MREIQRDKRESLPTKELARQPRHAAALRVVRARTAGTTAVGCASATIDAEQDRRMSAGRGRCRRCPFGTGDLIALRTK